MAKFSVGEKVETNERYRTMISLLNQSLPSRGGNTDPRTPPYHMGEVLEVKLGDSGAMMVKFNSDGRVKTISEVHLQPYEQ